MSWYSNETLNPMSNNIPPLLCARWVSNLRPVALIPFFGIWLYLDQNPHALIFATIARDRIHERGLIHVMKLARSVEPNFQHYNVVFGIKYPMEILMLQFELWTKSYGLLKFHSNQWCPSSSIETFLLIPWESSS